MDNLIFSQLTPEQFKDLFRQELEQFFKTHSVQPAAVNPGSTVMNLDEFCDYTGLARQTVYKFTGKGLVPHSKRGKRLYFDKAQVDAWLLENRVGSLSDIERKADKYLLASKARRR